MDETYNAWRATRAPDWLVAQGCEEAYWLGARDAWRHQQARIADLTRQLGEREAMLNDIQAALAHAGESVGERLVALEAEVSRYQGELLEALRERDEARALLAETGHPQ